MLRAESDSWGSVQMQTIRAMSPRQARAARAVLSLSVRRLADRSGVSDSSIRRVEEGQASLDLRARLQGYYEREGVRFTFSGNSRGIIWDET